MLVGDRRQFISAVIVPDFAALAAKLRTSGETDRRTVIQRADVLMFFDGIVEEVNASRPRHEQIRKFALLPTEFSVTTGELTPTLKVKRRVVGEKWNEVIDALYAPPAA